MPGSSSHGMVRKGKAQDMCNELFLQVEGPLGEAWISDDAYTDSPKEFLAFVRNSIVALDEAKGMMKKFVRKYRHLEKD